MICLSCILRTLLDVTSSLLIVGVYIALLQVVVTVFILLNRSFLELTCICRPACRLRAWFSVPGTRGTLASDSLNRNAEHAFLKNEQLWNLYLFWGLFSLFIIFSIISFFYSSFFLPKQRPLDLDRSVYVTLLRQSRSSPFGLSDVATTGPSGKLCLWQHISATIYISVKHPQFPNSLRAIACCLYFIGNSLFRICSVRLYYVLGVLYWFYVTKFLKLLQLLLNWQ